MAEQAKIMTLHDHDTGESVAPRTVVQALSGEGKKWSYVGFTEDNQVGLIEGAWPCNKNLLDNWYFVGGGSQQGGGQFPINQRGKTTYSATGGSAKNVYSFDRWYCSQTIEGNTFTANIEKDGITLSNSGSREGALIQNVPGIPLGTYTFSVLVSDVVGRVELWTSNDAYGDGAHIALKDGFNTMSATITSYTNWIFFNVTVYPGASVKIKAAKLELGGTQTLAHKEGDAWVLNEVPNYAEELAKCQRYFVKLVKYVAVPYRITAAGKIATYVFTLPTEMRATPTFTGTIEIRKKSDNALLGTYTPKNITATGNQVQIEIADISDESFLYFTGSNNFFDANL